MSGWLASTMLATLAFWSLFGACVDASDAGASSAARAIIAWDPRLFGDPHRVIIELEDPGGEPLAASVPCALGEVTIDAPHTGVYEGHAYAWTTDVAMHTAAPLVFSLDAPVTRWEVPTPR